MEKKKLKIAFLSYYSGDAYRGVETLVHELGNKLTGMGYEITIYQHGPKLPGSNYLTAVINTPDIKNFTKEVLKELYADIVLPMNGGWQSVLCKMWAKRNNKKVVISGQAGPGLDDRINLYTFPDAFLGMTDFQCAWAKKINPFVKVAKIPNGVDTEMFKPSNKKPNSKKILCVAALVPMKRLDLAIKAAAKVEDASLTLVGKGEQESYLKNFGREHMPGRVKVISVPYSEISEVYKDAHLFTFPTSPWESFGIAMLEAMASGLPVVASDDPIRREIVGDAGIFVNPENSDEYTKALESALENNWGDKPRKQAEKFSWDKIAKQYEDLFVELTND